MNSGKGAHRSAGTLPAGDRSILLRVPTSSEVTSHHGAEVFDRSGAQRSTEQDARSTRSQDACADACATIVRLLHGDQTLSSRQPGIGTNQPWSIPVGGRVLNIFCLAFLFIFFGIPGAFAADAEKLPPAPPRYFNDSAGLVSKQTAESLNSKLEQFERETSNQILVVIYPKLPPDVALEDFTQRTAEAWRVGQKKLDNGAVLFIFAQDRKMRIEVGYGLEGAIPDITARQIIDNEIRPHFRAGNYDAGVTAAVEALMKAARGEYKGTGRTAGEQRGRQGGGPGIGGLLCPLLALVFIFLFLRGLFRQRRGTMYGPRGRRHIGGGPPVIFWGGGGGGWGGGGGSSNGGGGFSGGGGSFGGGGASGDW